jgi:orotidine-5'-phosphate decarboxylase
LEEAAAGVEQFCRKVVDVVAPIVPAVKPQAAFFEILGPSGMQAYAAVVDHARRAGLVVIGDAKRNDIGSTAEAYATAFLGAVDLGGTVHRPFPVDALTVNGYFGTDGIRPFLNAAGENGTGLFVLLKTSNPSAGEIQDLEAGGEKVYEHMAGRIASWGADLMGERGYSAVGAVVGATYPRIGAALRERLPSTLFLVPGFGAQGGKADDLKPLFDRNGLGAVVNSSRGVLFAHTQEAYKEYGEKNWPGAVEAAAKDAAALLARAAGLGGR